MKKLTTTFILFNIIFHQSENQSLAPETLERSYLCLANVPKRYLNHPIQLERQNTTYEMITIRLSIQPYKNVFKIDVGEFTLYSITFEIGDDFRQTMPAMSYINTFETLLENNPIKNVQALSDMRKFIYTGDELSLHEKFVIKSTENKHKNMFKAIYYPLHMWFRGDDPDVNIIERELYFNITQKKIFTVEGMKLSFMNHKCSRYKKAKFIDTQNKLEGLVEGIGSKNLVGLIFQRYFENAFSGIQGFFLEDPNYFFTGLDEFVFNEYTSLDLPGEKINMEPVNQFVTGEVKIKTKKCLKYVGISSLVVVIIISGIIVGALLNK